MPTIKISQLTEKTTPVGTEEVAIADSGASKKIALSNITQENYTTTEKTKLSGIETGATADQTAGEIKTAYESNADTNAFTDADHTKLDGIEAGATADQTGAEIKTAYELEANTNAYTDAEKTKLAGIETGATADQTGAEIKTAYEGELDTNAYTDAEKTKLAGIADSANNYVHPTGAGNEHLPATVSQTEAGYLDGVTSAIQTQLDGKSSTSHNHDTAYVSKTSATGSAVLPTGTTAQRDGTPSSGYMRFNTTDGSAEIYDGSAWGAVGGGATGGGSDDAFYENTTTITADYTITTGKNAMSAGPITVNTGVTVTVPTGSVWHIL